MHVIILSDHPPMLCIFRTFLGLHNDRPSDSPLSYMYLLLSQAGILGTSSTQKQPATAEETFANASRKSARPMHESSSCRANSAHMTL